MGGQHNLSGNEYRWTGMALAQGAVPIIGIVGGLVFPLVNQHLGGFQSLRGKLVVFAWLALFVIAGMFAGFWPCPRCGKPFNIGEFRASVFRAECAHCGLPRGAKHDRDLPA